MILGLSNFVDSNWDTVGWILGGILGFAFFLGVSVGVRKRSTRIAVWFSVSGLVFCSLVAVAWHYFGWETEHTDTGWSIRHHRVLGRVTWLAYDTNGDWFAEAKVSYRFSDPWNPGDELRHNYIVAKEDRNHDGRWDTWWRPTTEVREGKRVVLIQADMDLDGLPDYEVQETADDYSEALHEITNRRGF